MKGYQELELKVERKADKTIRNTLQTTLQPHNNFADIRVIEVSPEQTGDIMKSIRLLILLLGLALISMSFGPRQAYSQQSRTITLAGYNHEPPVRTSGSGGATITFKDDTLRVEGDFSDLTGTYRGAYIMVGEKGEPGNMLFRLKTEVNEERTGGIIKAEDNVFVLNDAQKPLLEKGEFYINITSTKYSRGELRGQIPPMN